MLINRNGFFLKKKLKNYYPSTRHIEEQKDYLLISKVISEDAKKRKAILSLAWVDNKRAFDDVS